MNTEKDKNFLLYLSFIFFAALLIYGTFSPWLSVASIFNVAGNNSNYGIAPIVLAFGYIIFGLSGILKNTVLGQYRKDFLKGVLLINVITNIVLLGLLVRYLQAVSEFNKTTSSSAADLASIQDFLGEEFADGIKELTNSLKPQVGSGYVVCLVSSLIGLGILIFLWKTNFRTKSAEEEVL
jgi:hypothetical protein